MALPRTFKVSLAISVLIHAVVFGAMDRDTVLREIVAPPKPMLAKRSKPKVMRFELVETPAEAETDEPPGQSRLISDKNTRAQDKFQGDKKLKDSPHIEGQSEQTKNLKPQIVVSKPAAPPKPAAPQRSAKAEDKPKQQAFDTEKAAESKRDIPIEPKPERGEIIQLAKKTPVPSEPTRPSTPPSPPKMLSSASARTVGADAEITGEISFAASRHFFGEYMLKMKQAVETQWLSHLISQYAGVERASAVINFNIQPDGHVTDIEIGESEGDPYFALICVSSIRDAQPFDEILYEEIPGLPEEFVDKPLSIQFVFNYN